MKKQVDFTEGNIVWAIVRFSIPLILGELLQNLYNSVDALVAGNLVDQNALAAVTVCGVIANLVVNFFNAMSIGSNVVVAKANGSGERERLCHTIRVTFSFGVVLGVLLSLFGILLSPQLLHLAGAQESYWAAALTYLRIYLAGLMFTVIYNNAAGILRALGRADIPFRILVVSCGMNIALDLLFVSAFDMGIAGVGVATVLSQAVSVAMAYRTISREIQSRCLDLREMYREGGRVIGEVLRIGMAAGVQSALISFSNIFVVRYMNWFSADAVAGIGIAQRLDRFVILPAKSFGITMTTFLGQNLGAGKYRRIETGEKHCAAVAVVTVGLSMTKFEINGTRCGFSLLLVCMMTGTVFCNVCPTSDELMDRLDRWVSPINILFFVLSGAELDLTILTNPMVLLIGVVYIVARSAGKISGSYLSCRATSCSPAIQKYLGITLLPQAGVALGMAATAAELSDGHMVRNVVLFSVLVYELVGPTLTKISLVAAGEIRPEGRTSARVENQPEAPVELS